MRDSQAREIPIAVLNELGSGRSHLGRLGRGVRLLLALLLVLPQPVFAATIVVDESTCFLSSAITAANSDAASGGCSAGAGADTIQLAADVSLVSALPGLSSDITLEGGGFTVARTGGPVGFPVFSMTSGTVTLNEVTVAGGYNLGYNGVGYGGGVSVYGGSLTITNSTLYSNLGYIGGAVGGYSNSGVAISITNSTLTGNYADFAGGAVGAYINSGVAISITNSTLTGNYAYFTGGGVYASPALISNTIIADNGSVFYGSPNNCAHMLTGGGNNFADDGSCGAGFAGITPGVDFAGIRADNGGPTETYALLPGSVAINAAGVCGLPADQRGFLRDDGACDSGAYEFNGTPPVPCQPGSAGPGGIEPCTACPVGTSQPNAGAESCVPCAPGTFAAVAGSTQCEACAADTFQPDAGGSECLPCPPGATTGGLTGQTECVPEVPVSSPWSLLVLGVGLLAVLPVILSVARRREYET